MYKVFSNILLQIFIRGLEFHQPREQADLGQIIQEYTTYT